MDPIREDKAPEGWEDVVLELKKHPEIDNPFALANWMANQGYKPRKGKSDGEALPVTRLDISRIGRVERTPQGGIRVPANLTRVGVLKYTNPDGTVRREFRPPEEVFSADSLDSLRDAPVVEGHPAMVDPSNWAALSAGHVTGIAKGDGKFVQSKVAIQRGDTIAKIDSGELQEVSCGYRCEFDPTPGVYDGEPYDGIQRRITYNHIGLGPKGWGRAGSDVRLRLDGGSATLYSELDEPQQVVMKIRFDGKEFDKGSDEHIAALEAKLDGLPAVTKERDTLQAKFDAAGATIKDLQTKLDAANDPKRLDAAINERVALVVKATKVLGSEAKFDGLSVREIMTAVVSKTHPAVKLDGKSDDYVSALFDTAVESGFRADGIQGFDVALRTVQSEAARTDADDESKKEAEYETKRQTRATGKLEFSK